MPKQYQCRFCLENDEKQNLLNPCLCKGSSKYVHNQCLVNWYIHDPTKGVKCGVCTYMYTMKPLQRLEVWQPVSLFVHIHLYYPLPAILCTHWAYMFLLSCMNIDFYIPMYLVYQYFWHLIMASSYVHTLQGVENRRQYALHWTRDMRLFLPIVHSYFLCIIPKAGLIPGVAANMCMIYYFYEHYKVLNAMNQNRRIEFVSRS
jgi:hypothetical protein